MSSLKKQYNLVLITIFLFILIIKIYLSQDQENLSYKNNEEFENEVHLLRKLNFLEESDKVCKRSSDNLQKYYKTGDTKNVKFYENKVNDENPPDYILSLINYLSDEGNSKENYKNYTKHHILSILFFVISLACIPGWVTCCACKICNCCFFGCCKKSKCKLPFMIVVSIMNIGIIISSLFGLIKTKDIFLEKSNSECSILRFINEILEEENKNTLPRWGGIDQVIDLLQNTASEINLMASSSSLILECNLKVNAYKNAQTTFLNYLDTSGRNIYTQPNYLYSPNYILDIAKKFGKKNADNTFEGYYAEKWIDEINFSEDVEGSLTVLKNILYSNAEEKILNAGPSIELIKDGIEGIKDMIGEKIINNSEKVDSYGKLIFILIFSILIVFSIFMETILIFLYLFSMQKKCICSYCCINCCMNVLIHIFWNILAFLMIITFLFGTFIIMMAILGEDILYSFSFILGEKNLHSDFPKIIGEGGDILDVCINHDGILAQKLGIKSDLEKIDNLKRLTYNIDSLFNSINIKQQSGQDSVYEELINEINSKISNNDFDFVEKNPSANEQKINLKETISAINDKLEECLIKEKWSLSCQTEFSITPEPACSTSINSGTNEVCYNPTQCYNDLTNKYDNSHGNCNDAHDLGNKIYTIFSAINFLNNAGNTNSIINQGYSVRNSYINYLSNVNSVLSGYSSQFRPLTEIYNGFVGSGSIMGFINCAFMGKNFKVMLNYLKNVGKQLKTLGIILLSTGIAMAISISFTIVLVIIFNSNDKIKEIIQEDINNLPKSYRFQYDNPISQVYPICTSHQKV